MIIKACVSVGLHTICVLFIHAKTSRRGRGNYILFANPVWMSGSISPLLSCFRPRPRFPPISVLNHTCSSLDKNNLPVFVLENKPLMIEDD